MQIKGADHGYARADDSAHPLKQQALGVDLSGGDSGPMQRQKYRVNWPCGGEPLSQTLKHLLKEALIDAAAGASVRPE